MKSYPIYIDEYKENDGAKWILNTETEPQKGDVVTIEGKDLTVRERRYVSGGNLVLIVDNGRGRVVKA